MEGDACHCRRGLQRVGGLGEREVMVDHADRPSVVGDDRPRPMIGGGFGDALAERGDPSVGGVGIGQLERRVPSPGGEVVAQRRERVVVGDDHDAIRQALDPRPHEDGPSDGDHEGDGRQQGEVEG